MKLDDRRVRHYLAISRNHMSTGIQVGCAIDEDHRDCTVDERLNESITHLPTLLNESADEVRDVAAAVVPKHIQEGFQVGFRGFCIRAE
ncbi:hypothetical protein [Nocardia sp. NPDC050710]|uniref:hypothetical protein n=1 Tax=Nocardia sp. NPDC050710 TaxID=3157220 RepID=UPI0033F54627